MNLQFYFGAEFPLRLGTIAKFYDEVIVMCSIMMLGRSLMLYFIDVCHHIKLA